MSERYQKTYISATEFVESWDKELYELNHLDYFIFLMINYLGNRLEKHYFTNDRRHSPLFLDFDDIGTICFNISDSLAIFLEENCLGSCPLNCPKDLDGILNIDEHKIEDRIKKKLVLLQSLIVGNLEKEQCLRIDILNHVILDSLFQFYVDELDMDIKEDDLSLLDLAEFIENTIIDFIRFDGQFLLEKPFETAIHYFEELLESETEDQIQRDWNQDNPTWESQINPNTWNEETWGIDDVFSRFISDEHYNPITSSSALVHDINYFNKYLKDDAKINTITEIREDHIGEFFSVWLVREFVLSDEKQISFIFRAVARFVTYLYQHYHINLKREFLRYYDKLKLDLPRVIQAMNTFISEYNLLDALLIDDENNHLQKIGFFQISKMIDKSNRYISIQDIDYPGETYMVKLKSSAIFKLHEGDIIHARLINNHDNWEVLEIQFVYPQIASRFF